VLFHGWDKKGKVSGCGIQKVYLTENPGAAVIREKILIDENGNAWRPFLSAFSVDMPIPFFYNFCKFYHPSLKTRSILPF